MYQPHTPPNVDSTIEKPTVITIKFSVLLPYLRGGCILGVVVAWILIASAEQFQDRSVTSDSIGHHKRGLFAPTLSVQPDCDALWTFQTCTNAILRSYYLHLRSALPEPVPGANRDGRYLDSHDSAPSDIYPRGCACINVACCVACIASSEFQDGTTPLGAIARHRTFYQGFEQG